jgi:hypothetical protein
MLSGVSIHGGAPAQKSSLFTLASSIARSAASSVVGTHHLGSGPSRSGWAHDAVVHALLSSRTTPSGIECLGSVTTNLLATAGRSPLVHDVCSIHHASMDEG